MKKKTLFGFFMVLALLWTGCTNPAGENPGGGGTTFSSLMGTWTKSTGETVKGEVNWSKNFLNFWSNGTPAAMQADVSCEVISIKGTTVILENDYDDSYTYTVSITVTGTTLTISGFSGSYQSLNLTQFNGTYTKAGSNVFVPVTDITGVPAAANVGSPLFLNGTVSPPEATNKTIAWTIKNAGTTGASITGNTLQCNGTGTVTVTATIANGTAQGTAFTRDFTITVSDNTSFVSVASIGGIPTASTLTPLTLNGIVSPSNATNKTIVWSINDAGTTGATITGNTLQFNGTGTVTVTATIANGTAQGTAFTRNFTITVSDNISFIPVTIISGIPTTASTLTPLVLNGIVWPPNATNQTIVWSIKNAGATGATINGNTMQFTGAGTAVITATINSGTTPFDGVREGAPYTQDFTITVDPAFVPVTNIINVPTTAYVGSPLPLSGTVIPANANNTTISWSIQSGEGASLSYNNNTRILNTTVAGTVVVTATIANGTAQGTAFTRDFPIMVLASPPSINLTIENFNFTDEGIGVFTDVPSIVLSKAAKTSRPISATGLSDVYWYVGNIQLGTGGSVTLNAGNFNVGTYTLSITFSKNGKSWMGGIPFVVTE